MTRILYVVLVVLYLLHNDLWLWNNASLIAGIPAGLLYHIVYCFAATLMMLALVRFAWPANLETQVGESGRS
jgi:hypothetical protein